MWYLYSLLFCYTIGVLVVSQVVNRALENGTPLNDKQITILGFIVIVVMSIPLLNIVWSVGVVGNVLFCNNELYDKIDELIDNIRKSIY